MSRSRRARPLPVSAVLQPPAPTRVAVRRVALVSVMLVSVMLVSLMLIGCGERPDAERPNAERPAAERPAAERPTAERPAAAPEGPNVLTTRGLGPMRIGLSLAELGAALGGAVDVPTGAAAAECRYLPWRAAPAGVRVMLDGGQVARIDVERSAVATAAGARVGDTEARIRQLYPTVVVSPHKYDVGHYLTVDDPTDPGLALIFETKDDRVTRFRAGRRPQVAYVEGCS